MSECNLIKLNMPCPPMLEKALGYERDNRWVAFYWEPAGDELIWEDGNVGAVGEWGSWLVFVRHPRIRPYLFPYDLGSSDEPAKHWLLLDRKERVFYVGSRAEVHRFLIDSAPPLFPELSQEELSSFLDVLKEKLRQTGFAELSQEELATRLKQQHEEITALRNWLDNPTNS